MSTTDVIDTANAVEAKDASESRLVGLVAQGQSIWLDYITRDLVYGGELAGLITEDGLRGMTSNPTIFQKAIAAGNAYDDQLQELASQGIAAAATFEALAVRDIQNVNVTLLFSLHYHKQVMWAYIEALEARVVAGHPIDRIASVASFFVASIHWWMRYWTSKSMTYLATWRNRRSAGRCLGRLQLPMHSSPMHAFERSLMASDLGTQSARRPSAAATLGQYRHEEPGLS